MNFVLRNEVRKAGLNNDEQTNMKGLDSPLLHWVYGLQTVISLEEDLNTKKY